MSRSTVLVVEDDPLLRVDTAAAFEEAGLDVVDVQNADDALGYLLERAEEVAVVFTDVYMPGHSDGIHLAEIIARHWPHIRIVVTSGRARPLRALPEQVRFIAKPWRPVQLLALVQGLPEAA